MFYQVKKVQGGFAVVDWKGNIEIAYKNRKHAEQYAYGSHCYIFNEAETYNERRDYVLAYLESRKHREVKVPAQFEMF